MPIIRSLGALAFVLGVTLLALDAARSVKIGRFEATTLEQFWTNLGGDALFQLRLYLFDWLGNAAQDVLAVPAAFVAFGIGLALLLFSDPRHQERKSPIVAL